LGKIALEQDRYDEAITLLSESRCLREQLGDEIGIAETLFFKARVMQRRGDYATTEDLARRALAIQMSKGDENSVILTLVLLARNALELGRIEVAANYGAEALALSQKLQRLDKQTLACDILAEVYRNRTNLIRRSTMLKTD